jgi:hypothetical protein
MPLLPAAVGEHVGEDPPTGPRARPRGQIHNRYAAFHALLAPLAGFKFIN